ncbi:MAG: hypothetical protein ACYCUM_08715 [Solirubrobacteraceae bacterium]
MLIVGSLLALVCGLANSAAAALEKREVVQIGAGSRGVALLAVLIRRRWWLLAMALSVLAWAAEAGSLALAPVPVVTTLRSFGRGGLVLAGHRWLGERFGRVELAGVALLAIGGVLTASSVIATGVIAPPLSATDELIIAASVAALAGALSRSESGLVLGSAVGILFVATGIFTKEIGDAVARQGLGSGLATVLATPGPYLLAAISVWALVMLQHALARANAASVSAANTTVSANGFIVAGLMLYDERLASGTDVILLLVGLVLSAFGGIALASAGAYAAHEIR